MAPFPSLGLPLPRVVPPSRCGGRWRKMKISTQVLLCPRSSTCPLCPRHVFQTPHIPKRNEVFHYHHRLIFQIDCKWLVSITKKEKKYPVYSKRVNIKKVRFRRQFYMSFILAKTIGEKRIKLPTGYGNNFYCVQPTCRVWNRTVSWPKILSLLRTDPTPALTTFGCSSDSINSHWRVLSIIPLVICYNTKVCTGWKYLLPYRELTIWTFPLFQFFSQMTERIA